VGNKLLIRIEDVFKLGNTLHLQFSDQIGQIKDCQAVIKNIIKGIKEDKLYLEFLEKDIAALISKGTELTICYLTEEGEKRKFGSYVIEQKIREDQPLVLAKPIAIDYTSFRRYHRVDVDLPFRYFVNDKAYSGKVVNLSACGLFAIIEPQIIMTIGSVLQFEFDLPRNSRPTRLTGRIIRDELIGNPIKQGIAIDFEHIDKYDQSELMVFVTKTELGISI
jgi:c-di-GMP-binding flagellar brake protein YcgR